MRAPKLRHLRRRDSAEVGVGTLIVFIAMVLVAAVAAAVIIGTSGSLQQRAQQTGNEATADVSSNVRANSVTGIRSSPSGDIETLRLTLTVAPGSQPVDLRETLIRYSDGSTTVIYKLGDPTNPFTLNWVRGSGLNNVMQSGDLVDLDITLATPLAPRKDFHLQLLHVVGAPQELELVTPATYSSALYLPLQ